MSENPLIEITIDEMEGTKPTFCSPYVWIVRINDQDGCAIDVDYYPSEEAADYLNDFLKDIPAIIFRTVFEAVECKLHDIEGDEAVDAIAVAFSRYFEDGETPHVNASQFNISRNVDFKITTAWDGETESFTLLTDGELKLK